MLIPNFYIIEPTRVCNYKCFMCPNRLYKKSEKGHMNYELFKKIIDDISKHALGIQLYWMGEPFLHPDIIDMIKYVKENTKAFLTISTNGSLLNKTTISLLNKTKLDQLIIDVDSGYSDKIYALIRKGGEFENITNNINMLIDSNKSIQIILQFIKFKVNIQEREDFVRRWQDCNCKLRFDWVDTWANQMPELIELACELSPYLYEQRQSCADLWNRAVVNYKGIVNLCCHDYKGLYNLGDMNIDDIETIWNNKIIKSIRNEHEKHHFNGLCEKCVEWAKDVEYKEFEYGGK